MSDSVTLWTVAHQAPLSMGFSRQEYWSGLPSPPPGDLPNPGIEPVSLMSPALASFTTGSLPLVPQDREIRRQDRRHSTPQARLLGEAGLQHSSPHYTQKVGFP